MPYCPSCGEKVREDANFCPMCGDDQERDNARSDAGNSGTGGSSNLWYWTVLLATAGWIVAIFGAGFLPDSIFGFIVLASWIGLPVGIYLDSRGIEHAGDWPKYRWAYILGALVWIFAIIPGAIYAWKRRSITGDPEAEKAPQTAGTEGTPDLQPSGGLSYSVRIEQSDGEISLGENQTSAQKLEQSAAAWVPPGSEVGVKEFEITDGMVYVGRDLSGIDGFHSKDPALIDPSLDIDVNDLDPEGHRMSYYPSYSDIDPGCRATYLEWLANGRRDPDIAMGYVFLFFYGIERRVLFDAEHSEAAKSEVPMLLDEVEQLLEVYGEESSFPGYASRLLQVAWAKYDPESLDKTTEERYPRNLPIGLQIRIGRQLDQGKPVTAELAYEWFTAHPNTYLRTPGRRCESEFKTLFLSKFDEWYGDGWRLDSPEDRLTLNYRAASRSIPQQEDIEVAGVPDISAIELPVEKFQELANECSDELDEYSRYVGRTDDRESLEAMSLLPRVILAEKRGDSVKELIIDIEGALGSSAMANVELDLILRHFWDNSGTEVRKKDLRRVATLLEKLGFGMEPDPRFSAPGRGWGDRGVIFKLHESAGYKTSEVTPSIRLVQRLAMKIALANDDVAPEQTKYLAENLGEFLELDENDHQRLQAHRQWLILDTPTLHGVRQRAEDLSEEQSVQVGKFLTALAASDGQIERNEIEELRKIYPMLGLEETLVGRHLEELQTPTNSPKDDPVTIREAESRADEYQIPEPSGSAQNQPAELDLDRERVATRLQESKEVNSFLSDIFQESTVNESPDDAVSQNDVDAPEVELDESHQEFLLTLLERTEWSRGELESISREHGLFPDAAIEIINEYAYEESGSPVLEGTDEIRVNQKRGRKLIS